MKLNYEIRNAIIKDLQRLKFDETETQMRLEKMAIADAAYRASHTSEELEILASLPAHMPIITRHIHWVRIGFNGAFVAEMTIPRPTCYLRTFHSGYGLTIKLDIDGRTYPDLIKRTEKFLSEEKALKADKIGCERNLRFLLDQYSTDRKLIADWPDIKPVVEKHCKTRSPNKKNSLTSLTPLALKENIKAFSDALAGEEK